MTTLMQPVTFGKSFLTAQMPANKSRPRTLSPIGASGSGMIQANYENHLEQALDLVLSIAARYKADKLHFTTDQISKMKAIGNLPVTATATAGIPPPESPKSLTSSASGFAAGEGPKLERKASTDRMNNLFGKLKQVTQSSHLYKEMTNSKANLQVLSKIQELCAEAGPSAELVAAAIVMELKNLSPPLEASVYMVEPTCDAIFDPFRKQYFAVTDSQNPIVRILKETKPYRAGDSVYLPLYSGSDCVGGVKVKCQAEAMNLESDNELLHGIMSTTSTCVKNVRLIANVKWQVEKAEAMLMMANQLSRDNLDERILAESIMQTAKQLTESDRCSIFIVKGDTLQAFFGDGKTVTLSIDSGIAGHVAKTGETVNIVDAYDDARFNSAVDKATGYKTKTILCMPVHYEGSIVAVAQLINKKPKGSDTEGVERIFSKRDEELFHTFSTFAGVSLRNCRINANLVQEQKKSEAVLDVVHLLSDTDIRDVNGIVSHVMLGAKKLLNADRSSLFLFDKERDELYSRVADHTGGKEIRFSSGKGIAGTVAKSGIAENITDAYEDERFNREVDKAFNYRTRSILCEPITCKGDVLAVAQLVNRIDPETGEVTTFTSQDEETFRTFAMFAGISISNSHLLEFAVKAGQEAMELNQKRDDIHLSRSNSMRRDSALEAISDEELSRARSSMIEDTEQVMSKDFDLFCLREKEDDARALDVAVQVVMTTMKKTGLPEKFKCPEDVLLNFVCQCRKKYRKVPYHNFFHAVDACQTIQTFLFEGKLREFLTELECFVLLITALVHDLDHMGLNNSFHLKTDSPLGILSSASGNNSVLEVHHCNLAIEILEDPKSNVFIGLDAEQSKIAYRRMIDCVLATDMARHNDLLSGFIESHKDFEKTNDDHRGFAMKMIMKAADISNVTKPFEVSKKWAMAVTEEFYQQGDKEKEKGVAVMAMFDRSAGTELAKGQIGFINFICIKYFEALAEAFPGLQWTIDNVRANVAKWQSELEENAQRRLSATK